MVCGYVLLSLLDIKKKMFNVRLAVDHLYRNGCYLAVACDAFGGVLFCAVLFPTRCLG